jgi:hypothetical protein
VRLKSRRRTGLARARAARAGSRGGVRPGVRRVLLATLVGSAVAAVALTVMLLFGSVSLPGIESAEEPGGSEGWPARAERLAGGSAELAGMVLGGELSKLAGAALERLRPRHAEVPLRAATVALVLGGCGLALWRSRRSGRGAGVVRLTALLGVVGGLLAWPQETVRLAGLPAELVRLATRRADGQALVADYWSTVAGTAAARLGGTWPLLRPLVGFLTLAYLLPFALGVLAAAALAVGAQVVLVLNAAVLAVELPRLLFGERPRGLGRRVGLLLVGAALLAGALLGLLGLLWAAAKLRTWPVLPVDLGPLELLARAGLAWLGLVLVVVVVAASRKRRP